MDKHRKLLAWQRGMDLVVAVYKHSRELPKSELYGLVSQLRRAAVSVPTNIAEGFGRRGPKEFLHFLGIAAGSLAEVDTLLETALRTGMATADWHAGLSSTYLSASKATAGLIKAVRSRLG